MGISREQGQQQRPAVKPDLSLMVHADNMAEILHILEEGLDQTGAVAASIITGAVTKIRDDYGTRDFRMWAEEGERTKDLYNQILSKLQEATRFGYEDAASLLSELTGTKH